MRIISNAETSVKQDFNVNQIQTNYSLPILVLGLTDPFSKSKVIKKINSTIKFGRDHCHLSIYDKHGNIWRREIKIKRTQKRDVCDRFIKIYYHN